MLTSINNKKKIYIWTINIVILITMFISILQIMLLKNNNVSFIIYFSLYFPLFIISTLMIILWFINLYKNSGFTSKLEYLYFIFYLFDILIFLISIFFNSFSYLLSFVYLSSIITSIIRVINYNISWKAICC